MSTKEMLRIIAFLSVMVLIFDGIIALTVSVKLAMVFIISFVIFVLLMLLWSHVLEPSWWGRMTDQSQEKNSSVERRFTLLIFVILFPAGILGGDSWGGEGQVNLFPEDATSKNYRLVADIEVKTHFLWRKTYKINSVEWPYSGTSYFSACTIGSSDDTCTDDEGRSWRIELVQPPDAPDNSND